MIWPGAADTMQISVIIPTYNRRQALELVLRAYEAQEPRDLSFEVVVVDDGSTDGTLEWLTSWRPLRYSLRLATQPNSGPSEARNRALTFCRGELVLFIGDDIEPIPRFLAEHWQGHLELADPGAAVLGLTLWAPSIALTATMRHIVGPGGQQFSYGHFKDGSEYDFRHLYTSNISLRRTLLDRAPEYFSSSLSGRIYAYEDTELAYRLVDYGLRIVYREAALSYHHHPYEVRGFYRRQMRVGEAAVVLYNMLPQLKKWVDLREIDWTRLQLLWAGPATRARLRQTEEKLAEWEERALSLAAFFDPVDPEGMDGLLWPLFRYGFLKGLAISLFPPELAKRLCAAQYLKLMPPAVSGFSVRLMARGLPVPQADTRAISSLLH